MAEADGPSGPDLRAEGARLSEIPEGGMLEARFDGESVVLLRRGGLVHAIGGKCTHYGGPLARGLFDGELVRCPWHHACFRPEAGDAVRAPAFEPVPSWVVETRGDRVFLTGARSPAVMRAPLASPPSSVVIVGGGAAGFAAAEMLRREGYGGAVTMVSADDSPPYDRPNVSKDYLAGTAQAEWMPLRPADWYRENRVEIRTGRRATAISPAERTIELDDGGTLEYGALLLATGASPVPLGVPGGDRPHVHTLRTMRDADRIAERAARSSRAVVVGASFIGLEAAASLRTRGLEVRVVAPDPVPMSKSLGAELGAAVRRLHERRGVVFHLGRKLAEVAEGSVRLDDGATLDTDLVVVGIGVRPNLELAEKAGLRVDRGVLVDEHLRTSAEGVWAAGDIARWPDRRSGERIRIEHWVVAERQGQAAARDILGRGEPFRDVPFFWSQHYDVAINYVGHAESWDSVEISGDLDAGEALVAYRKSGRVLAVATMRRDVESLRSETAMERGDEAALESLVPRNDGGSR